MLHDGLPRGLGPWGNPAHDISRPPAAGRLSLCAEHTLGLGSGRISGKRPDAAYARAAKPLAMAELNAFTAAAGPSA
jgi:hypothetical protein